MPQYTIDIGAAANDGTGDPLRTAFNEVNLNFDQVFTAGPVLSNVRIANNTILTTTTNGNLILAPNGIGVVQSNVHIVPNTSNIRNLGSATQRWSSLYVQYANISGNLDLSGAFSVGDLTVSGNLTVTGNTIQIGNLVTDAKTIQLANTAASANAANGSGITVGANDNIATLLYSNTANAWTTNIAVSAVGNVTAPYFIGNGSQLTGLAATYGNANVVTLLAAFGSNTVSTTGNITGNYFVGNGSLLTSLTGANVTGTVANATSATTAGTVTSNAQANITSVGTLTSLSSSGNVTGGNILTGGLISATGNVTGGNVLTAGLISATGNVTGGNVLTGGLISATSTITSAANITGGNILTGGLISATGNITGNYFNGNIQGTIGDILNVTSTNLTVTNISAPNPGNAVNIGAGGNNNLVVSNVLVQVQNVPLSVAGNVTGGNILTGGLISATGNITAGNLSVTGNVIGTIGFTGASITINNAPGGNEGAEIQWALPSPANTVLSTSLVQDVFQNGMRFFESGGNSRGLYMDLGNVPNGSGTAVGYRDIPQVGFAANATIAATDAGRHYYSTSASNLTLTIANNTSVSWAVGTAITVVNRGTGNITVARGTGVSLYLAGNSSTANRTVSTYGMATLINVEANVWMINGTGLT